MFRCSSVGLAWKVVIWILAAGLGVADAGYADIAPAAGAPARVALLPIAPPPDAADASTPDLAAALQAELAQVPGVQWIERGPLDDALRELAVFDRDAAGALEVGRWVQADLLVRGEWATADGNAWALRLEVVDLARGDLLVERLVSSSPQDGEVVTRAAPEVAAALDEAHTRLRDTAGRPVIAALFFRTWADPNGSTTSPMSC